MRAGTFGFVSSQVQVGRQFVEQQQEAHTQQETDGSRKHRPESLAQFFTGRSGRAGRGENGVGAHLHRRDEQRPHGGCHHHARGKAEQRLLQTRRHPVLHQKDECRPEHGSQQGDEQSNDVSGLAAEFYQAVENLFCLIPLLFSLFLQELTFTTGDIYIYTPGLSVNIISVSADYCGICLMADEQVVLGLPVVRSVIRAAYFPLVQLKVPKLHLSPDDAARLGQWMRQSIVDLARAVRTHGVALRGFPAPVAPAFCGTP